MQQVQQGCYGITPMAERTHYEDPSKSRIMPVALAILANVAVGAGLGFDTAAIVGVCVGAAAGVAVVIAALFLVTLYAEYKRHALVGPCLPPDFIQTLPAHPNQPVHNKVIYYPTGKQSTNAKFYLLENAKQSIELSANFSGGAHLDRLLDIFENKLQDPQFKIHCIVSEDLISAEQCARIARLNKDNHGACHLLITSRSLNLHRNALSTTENHAKILVVDGCSAIVGDSGIQTFYDHEGNGEFVQEQNRSLSLQERYKERFLGRATKSADLLVSGPLVTQMRENYFRLHAVLEQRSSGTFERRHFPLDPARAIIDTVSLPGTPSRKVSKLQFFGSDPDCPYNSITKEYVRLIQAAKKTITICNMEFSLVPELRDALAAAKKNNPKLRVTLITNGKHLTSPGSQQLFVPANRMHYSPEVVDRVCEFKVNRTLLHQKAMLVDDESWIIGSYNISPKSAYYDYESAVSGSSRSIGVQFKKDFEKMVKNNRAHILEGDVLLEKAKLGIVGRRFKPLIREVLVPCLS